MHRQPVAVVAAPTFSGAVVLTGCNGGGSNGTTLTGDPIKTHHRHHTAPTPSLTATGSPRHQLPPSDFTGLVPGRTYYAYDPATATYWAGAGLVLMAVR